MGVWTARISFVKTQSINFSIITPVYNCDEFIRETVESVLLYAPAADFEYIVVNDGSTDSTLEILEEFRSEIKIISQSNSGEASAVNSALKIASGRFSLVVSGDDPLNSSELFSEALRIFDQRPSLVAVYPDWQIIDHGGDVQKLVVTKDYSFEAMLGLNICIPGPGAIFRTNAALKIQGRNPHLRFGSDFDFWLRISRLGDFQRIPKNLAQWRLHHGSTSVKDRGLEMAHERIAIINEFVLSSEISTALERKALGNAYYSAAILRYFSKNIPYRFYLYKAFRIRRRWVESARFHEVVYLLFLPTSEYIWHLVKKRLKR
jgi:glycosyltransferase involved in cell wall biosynthesis